MHCRTILILHSHPRGSSNRNYYVPDRRGEHHEEKQDSVQVAEDCRDPRIGLSHLL
jgi:hypothetical protein